MFQKPLGKKAYTILLCIEYSQKDDRGRMEVDTIRQNLLDTKKSDGSWIKFEGLPELRVAVVDIAETREEAISRLSKVKYDVVICDRKLNGANIMGGTLKNFKRLNEDALFISLLNKSQKRGAILDNGSNGSIVHDGAGVQRLWEAGFYNALWKDKDFTMLDLMNLIIKGGRTKEEAMKYFGLDLTEEDLYYIQRNGRMPQLEEHTSSVVEEPDEEPEVKATYEDRNPVDREPVKTSQPTSKPEPSYEKEKVSGNIVDQEPTTYKEETTTTREKQYYSDDTSHRADDPVAKQRKLAEEAERQQSAGIAQTGMLQGRVAHASGNVVTVVLNESIDSLNISGMSLMGMPASILYLKTN